MLFFNPTKKYSKKDQLGFSLPELIVAVAVFGMVMTISTGAIYSVLDANRKSQSLRAVMDNLNFALETMTRHIRFATEYNCDWMDGNMFGPQDCSSGADSLVVNGSTVYRLQNGVIVRTESGGVDFQITAPEVTITRLTFRVFGSPPYSVGSNTLQPQVIIVVGGYAGSKSTSQSRFNIQTTVSQRKFDSQ